MYKLIFLILTIFPAFVYSAEWRQFLLEPDPWFSIHTSGKGQISIDNNNVTIKIESAQIIGTDKIKGKQTVRCLRAGIAHYINKDEWLVSSLSTPQTIDAIITEGANINIPPFTKTITVPSDVIDKEHWVILQIELINEEGKTVYGFTHEPD